MEITALKAGETAVTAERPVMNMTDFLFILVLSGLCLICGINKWRMSRNASLAQSNGKFEKVKDNGDSDEF